MPFSGIFRFIVFLRNQIYNLKPSFRAGIPVVSVGNISVGGTGKTPLCQWIAEHYLAKGKNVFLCLRGYGAGSQASDEAMIYQNKFGAERVLVSASRKESLMKVPQEEGVIGILDDGFQHRAVARDLEIVLIDAMRLPTDDRLIPAGFLREPLASLRRAHVLIYTHTHGASTQKLENFNRLVRESFPELKVFRAIEQINSFETIDGHDYPLNKQRIFLICGIGQPEQFISMIRRQGKKIVGVKVFPDHHRFEDKDYEFIKSEVQRLGADVVLMTKKDAVKWKAAEGLEAVIARLSLEIVIDQAPCDFKEILDQPFTVK